METRFAVLLETTAPLEDPPPSLNHPTLLPLIYFFSPLPTFHTHSLFNSSSTYSSNYSNMRMSCNGCRVLRKGCSENCSIRPCLQWIKSPDSQAHATLFLAKFYGRAGLINLITAGPQHLRPGIFKSLLYEACGRMVNPVCGSVGLLWTNSWELCQEAVEAVLRGDPITQISSSELNIKACDIRHVSKHENSAAAGRLHKVSKPRSQFKRTTQKIKPKPEPVFEFMSELGSSSSHDSVVSRQLSQGVDGLEVDSMSVETVEASLANMAADGTNVELELTLGFH